MEYVLTLASAYLTHLNGAAGKGFKAFMLLVKILDKFFLGTFIPGRLNTLHDFRPF